MTPEPLGDIPFSKLSQLIFATTLAIFLATEARTAWIVQSVTDNAVDRFLVAELRGGGIRRIYGIRTGNVRDGRIFEYSPGEGSRIITFQHSMVRDWVAGKICGRQALRAGLDDGSAVEVFFDGGKWQDKILLAAPKGRQPSNHAAKAHLGSLYPIHLKDGRIIQVLTRPDVDVPFKQCSAPNPEKGLYEVFAKGDVRGDGKVRYYGILHPFRRFIVSRTGTATTYTPDQVVGEEAGERIFELVADELGNWSVRFLTAPGPYPPGNVVIGDGRNDGVPRLYAAMNGVVEFTWRDQRWESRSLGFSWAGSGIVIGRFRDDGVNRVYTGNLTFLQEYTHSDGRWRTDSFEHGRGQIGTLSAWAVRGRDSPRIVFSATKGGVHAARWGNRGRIAVAPFKAEGVGQEIANGFSDMLRLELVDRGNCDVLERTRMEDILKENSIAWAGFETAPPAKIGRLLGAEVIVAGTVGNAFGKSFASINIVSVQTGVLRRGRQQTWEHDDLMSHAIANAAAEVCPMQDPAARPP